MPLLWIMSNCMAIVILLIITTIYSFSYYKFKGNMNVHSNSLAYLWW